MRLDIESTVSSLPVVESDSTEINSEINRVLKQGVAAAQNGDRPMARTLLLNVVESDPKNLDGWLWLASISEYPEELLGFLENALDIDPENPRALTWKTATCSLLAKTHLQRGLTAIEENQREYAAQCIDKALDMDENCEMAWFWKASLLEDESEKLECLDRALFLNPENEDASAAVKAIESERSAVKMRAVRVLAAAGEHDAASEMLTDVLANEPENVEAWVIRSLSVRSFDEKFDAFDNILRCDPSNAFAQYGYDFLSELAEAVKPVEEAAPETSEKPLVEEPFEESQAVETATAENFYSSDENNDDQMIFAESSVEEPVDMSMSTETTQPETSSSINFFGFDEKSLDESPEVSSMTNEAVEEPVTDLDSPDGNHLEEGNHLSYESVSHVEQNATEAIESSPFSSFAELPEVSRSVPEAARSYQAEPYNFQQEPFNFNIDGRADEDISIHETPIAPFEQVADSHPEPVQPISPADAADSFSTAEFTADPAQPELDETPQPSTLQCPYCDAGIEPQSFSCDDCRAVLTLSDLESLLATDGVNHDAVEAAVSRMEVDWKSREFSGEELKTLAVGHFNLKNFDLGLAYLQEASRDNPNDFILSSQLNTLAIRLAEIRRHDEDVQDLPKGKTILVVDDSATVRKLISSKLEKCGHHVLCAVDGVEAMEMIETVTPDLVLLDIAMPRMDGYQVCKQIRTHEMTKDVPVVMISGRDGFFDKVRGKMAGSTDHITKPFGPETLMKTLETYLLSDNGVSE